MTFQIYRHDTTEHFGGVVADADFYPAVQKEKNFRLAFDSNEYLTKEGIRVMRFLDFISRMPKLLRS